MTKRIVIGVIAAAMLAFAVWILAVHTALTRVVHEATTPAEKKIEAAAEKREQTIDQAEAAEDKELDNDTMDTLIDRLRARVSGKLRDP